MSATSARLLVITNAAAGTNEDEVLEPALEAMRQRADVKVAATASPDELAEVLAQLDGRQVVVAGGDGSLHAVVQALYDAGLLHRTAVSLLPLGTGNDFARGMGIPLDTLAAVAVVLDGDLRPVDLITDDEGGIVINNVHAGVSAQASRHGARWKQRLGSVNLGKVGYPVGAAIAALRPQMIRLDILVDGNAVSSRKQPVLMLSVGNSSHVGGGTPITPDATPEDGRADVMVSFATGGLSRLGFALTLRKGEHQQREDVRRVRGRVVSIRGRRDFWCSADGEITGPHRAKRWVVQSGALQMVLAHHGDEVEAS